VSGGRRRRASKYLESQISMTSILREGVEPAIGRAFARPVGGFLRVCECISGLILRSIAPAMRLEGWRAPCLRPSFETLAAQAPQDEVRDTFTTSQDEV
jgi:hypothetical protein